jgi:hypothetical protein
MDKNLKALLNRLHCPVCKSLLDGGPTISRNFYCSQSPQHYWVKCIVANVAGDHYSYKVDEDFLQYKDNISNIEIWIQQIYSKNKSLLSLFKLDGDGQIGSTRIHDSKYDYILCNYFNGVFKINKLYDIVQTLINF